MPIYKSNQPIEVIRKTNTKGLEIMVGDQIHVNKYTATCQKKSPRRAPSSFWTSISTRPTR